MAVLFSRLASKLAQEDKEEEARKKAAEEAERKLALQATQPKPATIPAQVPPPVVPAAPVQSATGDALKIEIESGTPAKMCLSALESVCKFCGKTVKIGTPSVWIRKTGPDKKGSLFLHKECYEKLGYK